MCPNSISNILLDIFLRRWATIISRKIASLLVASKSVGDFPLVSFLHNKNKSSIFDSLGKALWTSLDAFRWCVNCFCGQTCSTKSFYYYERSPSDRNRKLCASELYNETFVSLHPSNEPLTAKMITIKYKETRLMYRISQIAPIEMNSIKTLFTLLGKHLMSL